MSAIKEWILFVHSQATQVISQEKNALVSCYAVLL